MNRIFLFYIITDPDKTADYYESKMNNFLEGNVYKFLVVANTR